MGIPARKLTGVCEITTGQLHDVSLPPAFGGESGAIEVTVTLEYGGAAASVSGLAAGMYLYDPYADTMTDEVGMTLAGNAASGVMPGAFFAACGCPLLLIVLTDPATGRRMVAGSLPLEVKNVCGSSVLTLRAPTPSEVVYVGRAPYIGANNHWMVWDNEALAYKDSGVLCIGTGVASVNGVQADADGNVDVLAVNLLDNSNFLNPVNQRGITWPYTGSAGQTLTFLDRWKSWTNDKEYTLTSNGLTIKNNASSSQGPWQVMENSSKLHGKTYTLACCYDGNKIVCGTVTIPSTIPSQTAYLSAVGATASAPRLRFIVIGASSDVAGEVQAQILLAIGTTFTIKWFAMYEGAYTADTLPPYVPKPYSVELAECQRYYVRWNADTNTQFATGGSNSQSVYAPVHLAVPMRTKLASIEYSNINIYPYVAGKSIAVTSLTVETAASSNNVFVFQANYTATSDLVQGSPACIRIVAGGYIALSADL